MLTSTYTLVALSVEQARVRLAAKQLLTNWSPSAWPGEPPTMHQLQQACDELDQFVASCAWRKLDRFVLPALRRLADSSHPGVEALLTQLDSLAHEAEAARACARRAALAGEFGCLNWLDRCCALVLARIEREENELVLVARNALTLEDWRAMSHRMLAHDVALDENRSAPSRTRVGARAPHGRPPPVPLDSHHAPGACRPARDVVGWESHALPYVH